MGVKDLHKKPFDEGTNCKLEIFEKYTEEWLPVFVMNAFPTLCIYDLFAGPGYDIEGKSGSPIRILNQVLRQANNIIQKNKVIGVWFNEADKEKYEKLKIACDDFIANYKVLQQLKSNNKLRIKITDKKFEDIFQTEIIPRLHRFPSLVFLDQNGVKHTNMFAELVKITRTDFLYFISSSYVNRFGNTDAFQNVLPVDMSDVRSAEYKDIHQVIVSALRKQIPNNSAMKIYPFSIKKGKNIYGIVFGSSNILGVDKFLRTTWSINPENGSANFDIEDDKQKAQLDIFKGKLLTKLEKFEQDLRNKILTGEITDNQQAYIFTLEQGHISEHATRVIKQLKNDKLITYNSRTPAVNYDNVYKKNIIVTYQLLHK